MTPDPDEVAAVMIAVRTVVNTFKYNGIPVGEFVTDDEIKNVSIAAIQSLDDYRNADVI